MARFSKAEWALTLLFLVTLPLVKVQVRQDGIAYYGIARSLVVDHDLQFNGDWRGMDPPSIEGRDKYGRVVTLGITKTGHLPVHSAMGASLLWMPFIAATHEAVLTLDRLGAHIPADGFSRPYLIVMVGATCLYALAGLLISFRLARQYVDERWAFLATVALWLGSSLPAYIYVDPAWSHAHSVFVVALFLWYWNRTRAREAGAGRSPWQWFLLGLISGLMVEVYFPNVVFALAVVFEVLATWLKAALGPRRIAAALRDYSLYAIAVLIAFAPTLVARTVLFGSPLAMGAYGNQRWHWLSPSYLQVLFSHTQGLFTTTPIIIAALAGIVIFARRDALFGRALIAIFVAFCTIIAAYPYWNLGPSFGNRYFISLTPAFILGLAFLLSELARRWGNADAFARRAWTVAVLLIVWNVGLVFQWNVGLMPSLGRVYWDEVLYNQFRIVPGEAVHALRARFSFRADGQPGPAENADSPF